MTGKCLVCRRSISLFLSPGRPSPLLVPHHGAESALDDCPGSFRRPEGV